MHTWIFPVSEALFRLRKPKKWEFDITHPLFRFHREFMWHIWLGCSNKYCFEAWAHNCALIEMCAQLCAHLPLSEPFETHTINGHHCMVWANPTYPTHETLQLGPILSLYIFSQVILSKGHLHCTQTKWVHKCALIFCRRGLSLHENTACNATAGRPGRAQATKHESPEVR